ncbi:MAG: ankyrin repeat domain-containing protein [Granulosicoccaceae bacterium]
MRARLLFCSAAIALNSICFASSDISNSNKTISDASLWIKAISNDDVDQLQILLSKSDHASSLLESIAPNGKTALMVASKRGDLALVKALFGAGASVNTVTKTGGNAFMFAVLGNHIEIAKWLTTQKANISAAGSNGWSAVTIAAAMGHADTLKWLTTLDSPIDVPDVYRFTPLMRAADNGHYKCVELLLETSAVDVNAGDEWENTALHFVMANKNIHLLELLLHYGGDINKPNRDGMTPAFMLNHWPEAQQVVDRFQ